MPDYFTLAELRALPDMGNTTKFPEARCEAVAAAITAVIEREVGTSFIPRAVIETIDGPGRTVGLQLKEPYVRSIVSVTENGVAVTDQFSIKGGWLRRYSGTTLKSWAAGIDNIVVTYQAGYSAEPPPDVKEWAMKGTRAHLLSTASDSAMNSRQTSQTTDQGVVNFIVAGANQPTGYPEVDAMILAWAQRIYVPKVGGS